jgi:mycofactocin biosynthetic radical S-adenosylmethionine protein MftC
MLRYFMSPGASRPEFMPPSYTEAREGKYLLIWRMLPYWIVVDQDLYEFLRSLDGIATFQQLLESRPGWRASRNEIAHALRQLKSSGVLVKPGQAPGRKPETEATAIQNISINITRRCNLRCPICYNGEPASGGAAEIGAQEINDFIEQSRPLLGKRPSLTILGGEPLLRKDELLKISARAISLGFSTLVSTNGTQVTDDFADRARETGLQVQVSIDGPTAEISDRTRGNGSFAASVRGAETLAEHGVYTILSMVCHRDNLTHIEAFYDFARRIDAKEARFIPLKAIRGGKDADVTPVDTRDLLNHAFEMFKRRSDLLDLAGRDAFTIVGNTCRYSSWRRSCGTGCKTLLLDSDGSIYPCLNTNYSEFRMGNIRDSGFDMCNLWRLSPELGNYRKQTSVNDVGGACCDCPVGSWCVGGCRGEAYSASASVAALPPNCADLRASMIEMMWMLSESPDIIKRMSMVC